MPSRYTLEGDVFKSRYIDMMSRGGPSSKLDRAIDIIYQTPDDIILPYLEKSLKRNTQGDPEKLIGAVKTAEGDIFKNYQAAPWDEVHHGRYSLSSLRNSRYLTPEERVLTFNKLADSPSGAPGNSPDNLGGNSADRRAHTGGKPIGKTNEGLFIRDVVPLDYGSTSDSMHPLGTNAATDPRGIVVPKVDTAAEFVPLALGSSQIQFRDTVSGREQDMARRIAVQRMIESTNRGDLQIGPTLLYEKGADAESVKASKRFLQERGSEARRINMMGAYTPYGSPRFEARMKDPVNAALRDMYESVKYNAGFGETAVNQLKSNWKGLTIGALSDRQTGVKLGQGDVAGAGLQAATTGALGAVAESTLKGAAKGIAKRAPAALVRAGTGIAANPMLMPALTAITAADFADGVVEGITGKSTISHIIDPIVERNQQENFAVKQRLEERKAAINSNRYVPTSKLIKAGDVLQSRYPDAKPSTVAPKVTKGITTKPQPQLNLGNELKYATGKLMKGSIPYNPFSQTFNKVFGGREI